MRLRAFGSGDGKYTYASIHIETRDIDPFGRSIDVVDPIGLAKRKSILMCCFGKVSVQRGEGHGPKDSEESVHVFALVAVFTSYANKKL